MKRFVPLLLRRGMRNCAVFCKTPVWVQLKRLNLNCLVSKSLSLAGFLLVWWTCVSRARIAFGWRFGSHSRRLRRFADRPQESEPTAGLTGGFARYADPLKALRVGLDGKEAAQRCARICFIPSAVSAALPTRNRSSAGVAPRIPKCR
jgi:hypothetical protein